MNSFRLRVVVILISVLIMLCGCENIGIGGNETDLTETQVTGVTGELLSDEPNDTLSDYPVTINDTVISRSPQKVICLSESLTEIIYELGFGDRLIGRGSYCDYPAEAAALKDYGKPSSPDLEAIRSVSPDLIVTATTVASKDVTALSEVGISVLYIPSPRSVDEYGRIYRALGMVFEGLCDGEKNGNYVFEKIETKLKTSDISLGTFIYITEGGVTAGGDTFESSILSLFGVNAAENLSGYVLSDKLPEDLDPDVVILNSDVSENSVLSDTRLASLTAVSDSKIIKVSNSYFESPSGRITGLLDELSGKKEEQNEDQLYQGS